MGIGRVPGGLFVPEVNHGDVVIETSFVDGGHMPAAQRV
jgi:hypothetical protein